MRRFRPVLLLLAVVATALSWWLRSDPPPTPPKAVAGQRTIDYTINGLDVTRMTAAGTPAHRLRAARAEHFGDDDTTRLHAPHLTVFQNDTPPWELHADSALTSADGDLILLSGEVLIERDADADDRPLRILTRDLRIRPGEDYAETDERVRVESENDWLDATGMQAWLRPPSRLKFLSQVKGYYEPRPANPD